MVQTKYYCIILLLPRSQILDLPGCDSQIGSSSIMMLLKDHNAEKRKGNSHQSWNPKSEYNLVVIIFTFIQMLCTQWKFLVSVCLEPTLKSP